MICWSGRLNLASDDSNRWRRHTFRVRGYKLEFLEAGDASSAPSPLIVKETVHAVAVNQVGRSNSGRISPDRACGPDHKLAHRVDSSNDNDKDKAVAKLVEEAPRGSINLEDVSGFLVLGGRDVLDPLVDQYISLSGERHRQFHTGETKFLFNLKQGKQTWRLSPDQDGGADITKFFLAVERSVPRATVLAAGWVSTPGTINWNRRYVLLLSTGSLMIFKDASLENLRREIWLGEDACDIQPVKLQSENGSPEERAIFASLAKSYQGHNQYNEYVTVRVTHPSISDRGYLMSIERIDNNETPAIHLGRFREWVRILRGCARRLLFLSRVTRTANGAFELHRRRLETLRNSEESKLCLYQLVNQQLFVPSPTFCELARAGFPRSIRRAIWVGFSKNNTRKVRSLSKEGTSYSRYWNMIAIEHLPKPISTEAKDLALAVVEQLPSCALSEELVHMISFVVDPEPQVTNYVEEDILSTHDADMNEQNALERVATYLLSRGLGVYHQHSTTAHELVRSALGINPPQAKKLARSSSSSSSHDSENRQDECMLKVVPTSITLQVDVDVIISIVQDVIPHIVPELVKQSRGIISTWLLSCFTQDVPFSQQFSERLWDVIMLELANDDDERVRNFSVRCCVGIFLYFKDVLREKESFNEWKMVLTIQNMSGSYDDEMHAADCIVYYATRDRVLHKHTTWSGLKERRSVLWNDIETEARERASVVARWQLLIKDMVNLLESLTKSMNKVNATKELKDRKSLSNIIVRFHVIAVSFRTLLNAFQEALAQTFKSLSELTSKANAAPSVPVVFSLDEMKGYSNIQLFRGGQVAINPMGVIQVVRTAIALGWSLVAGAERSLCFADGKAFQSLHLLARCVANHDKGASPKSPASASCLTGSGVNVSTISPAQDATPAKTVHSHEQSQSHSSDMFGQESVMLPVDQQVRLKPSSSSASINEDFTESSTSRSLSGVLSIVNPPGDPKPSRQSRIAQKLHGELKQILHSLLIQLDQLAQLVIDTSVEQQRRTTEKSFSSRILVGDVFGGKVDVLCRLVPFIMSSADEIRSAVAI